MPLYSLPCCFKSAQIQFAVIFEMLSLHRGITKNSNFSTLVVGIYGKVQVNDDLTEGGGGDSG